MPRSCQLQSCRFLIHFPPAGQAGPAAAGRDNLIASPVESPHPPRAAKLSSSATSQAAQQTHRPAVCASCASVLAAVTVWAADGGRWWLPLPTIPSPQMTMKLGRPPANQRRASSLQPGRYVINIPTIRSQFVRRTVCSQPGELQPRWRGGLTANFVVNASHESHFVLET